MHAYILNICLLKPAFNFPTTTNGLCLAAIGWQQRSSTTRPTPLCAKHRESGTARWSSRTAAGKPKWSTRPNFPSPRRSCGRWRNRRGQNPGERQQSSVSVLGAFHCDLPSDTVFNVFWLIGGCGKTSPSHWRKGTSTRPRSTNTDWRSVREGRRGREQLITNPGRPNTSLKRYCKSNKIQSELYFVNIPISKYIPLHGIILYLIHSALHLLWNLSENLCII